MVSQRETVKNRPDDLDRMMARIKRDPRLSRVYEEEAAKKELWLQLVEARMAAGLTQAELAAKLGVSQAQVARIEKRGYDSYTLTTLRKYVDALGKGHRVEVRILPPETRRSRKMKLAT